MAKQLKLKTQAVLLPVTMLISIVQPVSFTSQQMKVTFQKMAKLTTAHSSLISFLTHTQAKSKMMALAKTATALTHTFALTVVTNTVEQLLTHGMKAKLKFR